MRATFHMRNGAAIEVDVKSITKTKNPMGNLIGFKWESVTEMDGRDLFYLNIDQVDAVVVVEAAPSPAAEPVVKM